MVLEAVMICVDNSEWIRNGDYSPSRLQAQAEAVQYVATAKLNGNPETTVGLLSMAGLRIEVHTSPTREVGSIMTAMARELHVGGRSNVLAALKTSQLALKNRSNKNQRQRIIIFIGSPITATAAELTAIGKHLRKNNISVDVVNFGAENAGNENVELLEALIAAVNSQENSHLVNIPPGPHVLSELVLSSPIIIDADSRAAQSSGGGGGGGGGSSSNNSNSVDENVDPEMAMAIRMSMEEERQRQLAATAAGSTGGDAMAAQAQHDATMSDNVSDEDAMLAEAIALSMQQANEEEQQQQQASAAADPVTPAHSAPAAAAAAAAPADEQLADEDMTAAMDDPDFINSLLSSVPGVNSNSLLDELNASSSSNTDTATAAEKKDDAKPKDESGSS